MEYIEGWFYSIHTSGHDQFDILLRIIDIVALKEFDWMKVHKNKNNNNFGLYSSAV